MKDYYQILQISSSASFDEIRAAFRKEAKRWHPDLYHGASPSEKIHRQKRFILITKAYETLSDSQRRKAYDQQYYRQKASQQKEDRRKKNTDQSSTNQWKQEQYTDSQGGKEFAENESMENLFADVEELLSQFGLQLKDPLSILVDWAKKVFEEFMQIWEEERNSKNDSFQKQQKTRSFMDEIEEELRRMKQEEVNNPSQHQFTNEKRVDPQVQRELEALKNKYRN